MSKNYLFYFGFILVTLIGLQSCKSTEDVIVEQPDEVFNEATKVAFKDVANGYLTGNGDEGLREGGITINSQVEWEALRDKMNSVNQAIKEQSLDFEKFTVLAYFDKVRGSGGYTVEFATISEIEGSVQVITKKTAPTGDAIEIMTQPYSIVCIDKTANVVVFIKQ